MRDFDAVRDDVLALFGELTDTARRRGATTAVGRLDAAHQRLTDGRLTVVVCGEFKRGKSSLLNALLDEWRAPLLFPEAGEIATNAVTTVSYGPKEEIDVLVDANGRTETLSIGRDEIARYVTESGNPHNTRRARLLSVTTPNPKLASGLTLVDTPGVGSVHQEHTAITMAFLPSADAIVFVADATQPLLESELRFLSRAADAVAAGDSADALQFVLTKTDGVADFTTMLANARRKIADTLGWPLERVVITPVSAHAKRDYLVDGEDEDLELSNFVEFETRLWTALGRWRAKRLLGDALGELERGAQGLQLPLDEAIEALADETKQKVGELTKQAEERQAKLNELQQGSAGWRRDLADELGGIGRQLANQGQQRLDKVWQVFNTEYLRDDTYLYNPDRLVGQLTADAAQVIGELNEQAGRAAAGVLRDFTARNGLDLGHPQLGQLPDPPVPHLEVHGDLHGENRPNAMKRKLRDAGLGSGVGAAIGGFLGSILMPGVGTVIGSALGSLFGSAVGYRSGKVDERKADRQSRRSSLQSELRLLEQEQRRHVTSAVQEAMRVFTRSVVAELDSRIAQERETVRDLLPRLADARQATQEKARQRTAELNAEKAPIVRARGRITALTRDVERLATATATTTTTATTRAKTAPTQRPAAHDDDWADA
ncbi:dynamin family protein [Dactylosporangium sp. NPDC005572]|uniref:dynamin family protein n=1 Tax=Dactylosporangium sp. NPDC005572 TaxID=3156889 RepID=UPI0033B766C4